MTTPHDPDGPRAPAAPTVHFAPEPDEDDIAVVEAGLRAFNLACIGERGYEPVHLFLRAADGRPVGGLLGHIGWRWLFVSTLWVDDAVRGQGHGRALMLAAEAHARSRDCLGVYLDTFEFQARPFYERLGYELFGTLDGYPAGLRQYHLAKRLIDG